MFRNTVDVLECFLFLDELREKFELKNWSHFSCMAKKREDFEKDVKCIYQISCTNLYEIRKYKIFMEDYFS